MTDGVEQGKPELLVVLLVAFHLQYGEPAPLPGTVGPGAYQRRLPAASRSRDDRYPALRRAIQDSEKVAPVNQPWSCWIHPQRPALMSMSDTLLNVGHAVSDEAFTSVAHQCESVAALGAGSGIIGQVDSSQIQAAFDDAYDQALVFHGFADYMRDYEVFVYATADPRTGIKPQHLLYRFTRCVRAMVTTRLTPELWQRSLDERLIDYDQGRDLDGYVWGVKWQDLYPGMRLVPDSAEARQWSRETGVPFHEAVIEANAQHLALVFSDLSVQTIQPGYAPFVVPDGGPDFKFPE
jgi:hypothetical protein